MYLLQLVQALKYESLTLEKPGNIGYDDTNLSSHTTTQSGEDGISPAPSLPPNCTSNIQQSENLGLATFLIQRACKNSSLANYFYWYLLIECEEQEGGMKKNVIVQARILGFFLVDYALYWISE